MRAAACAGWCGWGVRWLGGRRWLWRAAGWDVVEITLRDGGVLCVGADDVEGLCAALEQVTGEPEVE